MNEFICAAICQTIVRMAYVSTLLWVLAALTATLSFWLSVLVYLIGMALAVYAHQYVAPHLGNAGAALTTLALPAYMRVRGLFTKNLVTA